MVWKNSRASRGGHAADFGDGFSGDADGAGFLAQARAIAIGAGGVAAIAAEENADVQLVFFAFEILEEAFDADEIFGRDRLR